MRTDRKVTTLEIVVSNLAEDFYNGAGLVLGLMAIFFMLWILSGGGR